MALAGAFSYLGQQATLAGDTGKASSYGNAAVSMVFIFTSVFGATWFTVPWLYPAEIFPLQVQGQRLGRRGMVDRKRLADAPAREDC